MRPVIIRACLDRWYWQVGSYVDVPKVATLEQIAEIAPNHPVFHIHAKEIA